MSLHRCTFEYIVPFNCQLNRYYHSNLHIIGMETTTREEFFRVLYDRIGFRRNGISWNNIHMKGLLSTQQMQYLLNEPINMDRLNKTERRNLLGRFRRRFKNNDSIQNYLFYKDNILYESNFRLRGRRDILIDAFLLLDYCYIESCKYSLTRDKHNCRRRNKTVK